MLDFLRQYLTAVLSTLALLSAVYFLFWVVFSKKLNDRKIQLSRRAGWPQIQGEIGDAMLSMLGNTVFASLIFSLKDQGLTKFYTDTGRYGTWYEVLVNIALVLISDTWFYWFHRWMHHPWVYKYVHALHHKSLDVNPFTSNSFHVIESMLLTVWILPVILLMPISLFALSIVQALGTFNNIKSHLGYELFPAFFRIPPFNMLITATNHSLHHTQYNGNYGLFFRFWDIVCGTELDSTSRTFGEIHQRKNTEVTVNTKYRILIIDRLTKENHNIVSVYFKPADPAFYNYKAGQHLTLRVRVNGKVYNRCFSLSSSPGIDDYLRITVKLKGEVSHYFYNNAKAGDTVESLLPVGDFSFTRSRLVKIITC